VYTLFWWKPEGRRPLGRHRCRWEDNNKMNLPEKGCGSWTGLYWLRVGTGGGTCECGNEILVSIKCGVSSIAETRLAS